MSLFSRVSGKDKALITRQIATMLGSGLAIDQAFKILKMQVKNKSLGEAYQHIIFDLQQGKSLSTALSSQKQIFDPVFIAIVRSGENSGKLDKVLEQLADRLELTEDFDSKVRGAFYYPGFLVGTMFLILIVMIVYVIPPLKGVFSDLGVPLPWTTKFILWAGDFTLHYWWADLIILVLIGTGVYFFLKTKDGGSSWDRFKIKIPGLKDFFTLIYMARFCRTMSMLIQSGLPIMETISISSDVIQNRVYSDSLKNVTAQVERGIPMSVPLSKDKNFPIMVSQMILVGEQTGKMSQVLTKLAEYYERETGNRIKNLSSLIEPVLIVILGFGVAFLVFSLIWPIYSIAQTNF